MRIKFPSGKQILFPSLFLAVAAIGVLFFLQVRWMNNSLQAENMRYRKGVFDSLNHVARFTLDELNLEKLKSDDPEKMLTEWKKNTEFPEILKDYIIIEEYPISFDKMSQYAGDNNILFLTGNRETSLMLILDSDILYRDLLMGNLNDYASDYTFSMTYREVFLKEFMDQESPHDPEPISPSNLTVFLPLFINSSDGKKMENILSIDGQGGISPEYRGLYGERNKVLPMKIQFPVLEVNLNNSRGSDLFENKIRRINVGLIVSLCAILIGIYYLLLRLYRDEEKQRHVEQTFVASVSHELRTPIAVIKTASENLSRGIITDMSKVKSYGGVIQAEADRLNKMVESILYYSRLEAGGLPQLFWEDLNPSAYVKEILDSLQISLPKLIQERDLTGVPEIVSLDKDTFRLILENLVINSFLHGGGSTVRIRLESDFPYHWRLVIEDRGLGIPRKEQKRVFDPFIRGKRSEHDQIRGSGLGLYLVKKAVLGLGGEIKLESPYDYPAGIELRGCRFTVILPVHKEELK